MFRQFEFISYHFGMHGNLSETGGIRFQRVRCQTPSSVSSFALTELQGENSVSSFRPIICVPKQTHRVSCRTHRVCRITQWVLSSQTVLAKQYSARFLTARQEKHISLAHRNRRDLCDLRLRCPSRTPEINSDFRDKTQQCWIVIEGCNGKSLAICDFKLRFLSPKPFLSAVIWRFGSVNVEIARDCDCATLVR